MTNGLPGHFSITAESTDSEGTAANSTLPGRTKLASGTRAAQALREASAISGR